MNKQLGWSLTELLVALVLISSMLGAAIPLYQGQVVKAHQAEARAALIRNNQFLQQWFIQYGSYRESYTTWPVLPVDTTQSYDIRFSAQAKNAEEGLFLLRAIPRAGSVAANTPQLVLDQDGNIRFCETTEANGEQCWL